MMCLSVHQKEWVGNPVRCPLSCSMGDDDSLNYRRLLSCKEENGIKIF